MSSAARTKIAVVGAGIIGSSIAFRLVQAGCDVVLIDKDRPGSGASHGNAGMIANSEFIPLASRGTLAALPRQLLDPAGVVKLDAAYLARLLPWGLRFVGAARRARFQRAIEILAPFCLAAPEDTAELLEEAGASKYLIQNDFVRLFKSEQHFADNRDAWEVRRKMGLEYRFLKKEEIRGLFPDLGSGHSFGLAVKGYHHLSNPGEVVRAIATAAESRGAKIVRGDVRHLQPTADGVDIFLADGKTSAQKVVVAAGAFSHRLAARIGDNIPLETERGYHVQFLNSALTLDRCLAVTDLGLAITPIDDHIRVTSFVEFAGLEKPPIPGRFQTIIEKALRVFPSLDQTNVSLWMGHRPSLPDGLPVIGPSSKASRIFYCFGHGHVGMTLAAGTTRMLAEMLAGGVDPASTNPFSPDRF